MRLRRTDNTSFGPDGRPATGRSIGYHPYVRHVRYAGQRRTDAYAHGREAGKKIVIHKGVKGSAEQRGLLLGAKR